MFLLEIIHSGIRDVCFSNIIFKMTVVCKLKALIRAKALHMNWFYLHAKLYLIQMHSHN